MELAELRAKAKPLIREFLYQTNIARSKWCITKKYLDW